MQLGLVWHGQMSVKFRPEHHGGTSTAAIAFTNSSVSRGGDISNLKALNNATYK